MLGTSSTVDEQRAADAGAERDHHHDALLVATGAEAHLGEAGGVGVVQHDERTPDRLAEPLGDVLPDPRLVDVGGGLGHAPADDGRERRADGPVATELGDDLGDDVGDGRRHAGFGVSSR